MNLSPIILFVYNRPEHTLKTLEALSRNHLASESELYIYADGPKENANEETIKNIEKTRAIVKSKKWCKKIILVEREKNYGLSKSIITGVTEIIKKFGKIIVLEDDIITSKYFLQFMNEALQIYESEKQVYQIGACNFYNIRRKEHCFFLQITDCWGWATWSNKWDSFEESSVSLMSKLKIDQKASYIFNCYNSFNYVDMLQNQIDGKIDSWAIRWQAVVALNNGLVLYPWPSLTQHLASEKGLSTHYSALVAPSLLQKKISLKKIELSVRTSSKMRVKASYQSLSLRKKILYFLNRHLNIIFSFVRLKSNKL